MSEQYVPSDGEVHEPTDAESIARKNLGDDAVDRLAEHFGVTQKPTDETRRQAMSTDDPCLELVKIKGSDVVVITHRRREVEVIISPKGTSVRVYVDGEEWKP